ncbi:MAG: hypothetical protein ACKOOA_09400, partial [Sediminibacterium sp.]
MRIHFRYLLALMIAASLLLVTTTEAQVVWESPQKEIYPYLERMAQKGLIQFNDLIRPLSRQYIAS